MPAGRNIIGRTRSWNSAAQTNPQDICPLASSYIWDLDLRRFFSFWELGRFAKLRIIEGYITLCERLDTDTVAEQTSPLEKKRVCNLWSWIQQNISGNIHSATACLAKFYFVRMRKSLSAYLSLCLPYPLEIEQVIHFVKSMVVKKYTKMY